MKLKTIKSTNGRRRRGRGTSLWNILTGRWGRKHQLPAHVTREGDWEVEVPHIRMSRAFAVMLVLFIVAVGGLFAFRLWGTDKPGKAGMSAANLAGPATLVDSPPAEPPSADAPSFDTAAMPKPASSEPLKTYVWHSGDTLPLVAARFGITGSALRDANPDKQLVPGSELIIPRAGRVIGGPDTADTLGKPSEIFDPSKAHVVETSAPPRAVEVPELSPLSEIPDVIPVHGEENAAPVVHKLSTAAAITTARVVPAKVEEPPAAKKKPAVTAAAPTLPARSAGRRTHVVTKGDTVFNIAKRYGFTAEEIAKANTLDSGYRIRQGQQLRIPVRR